MFEGHFSRLPSDTTWLRKMIPWELFCCNFWGILHPRNLLGRIPNSPWNYNSHETTTLEYSNSTSWGPKAVTAVKWRLLHPATLERGNNCTQNSRQTTTIPSQQPWNDESEAQQSLPQEHEILCRFMAVVVSGAFRNSLTRKHRLFRGITREIHNFKEISQSDFLE